MADIIAATSLILRVFKQFKELFGSIRPVKYFLTSNLDLDKLVEDFFSGEILPNTTIRVRGVLSPYSCFVPSLTYRPVVALKADLSGFIPFTQSVAFRFGVISPPVCKFNDLQLSDNSKARIAWLYPENFKGLIFSHPKQYAVGATPEELFKVKSDQQPVLCLLPVTGRYDGLFGKRVELVGKVGCADSTIALQLGSTLDQLRIKLMTRVLRPFEQTSQCLCVDIRQDDANIKLLQSEVRELKGIIGVQGVIEAPINTDSERSQLRLSVIDAVPDRQGLGNMRGVGDDGITTESILSNGELHWMYDMSNSSISAFIETDLNNRELAERAIAKLSGHWQAWQNMAKKLILKTLEINPVIRPMFLWDQQKIRIFSEDGFSLPPRLQQQLFDRRPEIRNAVDWLRVGTGNYN